MKLYNLIKPVYFLLPLYSFFLKIYFLDIYYYILYVVLFLLILYNYYYINDDKFLFIYCLSLSLLLQFSTASFFPYRYNVDFEYKFYSNILTSNKWFNSISHPVNMSLSIILELPIIKMVTSLDSKYIFMVVVNLVYALIPVLLYKISLGLNYSHKKTLLITYNYIFFSYFFTVSSLLRRQQLALFLLTMIIYFYDKRCLKNNFILIILSINMLLFHYTLFVIYLFIILLYKLLNYFYKSESFINVNYYIYSIMVISYIWFYYTAGGIFFNQSSNLLVLIIKNIFNLFEVEYKSPVMRIIMAHDLIYQKIITIIWRSYYYLFQIFIIIGYIKILIIKKQDKISYILNFSSYLFYILLMVLPFISIVLNPVRVFFIILILNSPMIYEGFIFSINLFSKIFHLQIDAKKLFLLFLCIFYFLEIGLVGSLLNGVNPDIDFNIPVSEVISYENIDTGYHLRSEFNNVIWNQKYGSSLRIYADTWIGFDLISIRDSYYNRYPVNMDVADNSILFLRNYNIVSNSISFEVNKTIIYKKFSFDDLNNIYTTKNSKSYLK
ncbi:MAG: DUF2206 domain-containing protein [Candidatus Helarchaeota archaeon]